MTHADRSPLEEVARRMAADGDLLLSTLGYHLVNVAWRHYPGQPCWECARGLDCGHAELSSRAAVAWLEGTEMAP